SWVRAPAAGVGVALGAFLGAGFGYLLGGAVGSYIGAGVFAIVGDFLALVSIGIIALLIRGRAYLVAIAVPSVAVYLALWFVAGRAAESVAAVAPGFLVPLLLVAPALAAAAAGLVRAFTAASAPLVLGRPSPRVLGDRLITAVELAEPKKAARYGYSEVM